MRSYILDCPKCSYATRGDDDGAYFYGWLDDLTLKFLSLLPSKYGASSFITTKDSMDLFEDIKIIEEENENLDFKEEYNINSKGTSLTEGAKKELRKDICSFANYKGGCIFIGVKEITSQNTELIGILNQELYTQEFIDQILSSGPLNPSIVDVRLHKIIYNNNWYVIIEIPESNLAPHFLDGKIPFRFGIITKYFDTKDEWNKNKA